MKLFPSHKETHCENVGFLLDIKYSLILSSRTKGSSLSALRSGNLLLRHRVSVHELNKELKSAQEREEHQALSLRLNKQEQKHRRKDREAREAFFSRCFIILMTAEKTKSTDLSSFPFLMVGGAFEKRGSHTNSTGGRTQ